MKKKLLIVTDSFLPRWDGVARFLSEVIPRLTEKFHITVIAPDFPGNKIDIEHTDIVRFPLSKWSINDFPIAKVSKKKIKPYIAKSDIVWIQGLSSLGKSAINVGKKLNKPLLAYAHVIEWEIFTRSINFPAMTKGFVNWVAKLYTRRMYNKCNLLMVPSAEVAYIFEKEKIVSIKTIVPLGINSDKFKPVEDKKQAKRNLDIDPGDKIIGYCGRIGREKNLITLFRAFTSLKTKFPKAKLLLVGKGPESQEQIFKDKRNIILTGKKDNVIPYLQAMDIYVLPSFTETTSLSTLEAMSCGLPVIVTPLEAMKKYIIDKKNGFFFPKENWLVLRKKIEYLLQHPHIRFAIGQQARKTVKRKYSWDLTVDKIRDILERY